MRVAPSNSNKRASFERRRITNSRVMGAKGRAKGFMKEDPSLARAMGVDGGGGANDGGGGRWKGGGGRGRGRGDGSGGARRARPMTAISLDKFARAKTSTYDKRAVLEKRRNLEAGKVNKYRKVRERLGDTIERPDGFDPDEYARRLEAQRATQPAETNADILAMAKRRKGKGGLVLPESRREPTPEPDDAGAEEDEPMDEDMKRMLRRMEANDDDSDDADDADDAGNIVDGERRSGKLGEGMKGVKGGKGWNKTVAAKIKADKEREENRAELKVLKVKWAEEDAGRKKFFEKRNEGRDKFRKKTRKGQPVMKHRMDAILEKLQAGQ